MTYQREPQRVIQEGEQGLILSLEILWALFYLFIYTPIRFIVDLIRRPRRKGRHAA